MWARRRARLGLEFSEREKNEGAAAPGLLFPEDPTYLVQEERTVLP